MTTTFVGHVIPRFPAKVVATGPVTLAKSGLTYTFGFSMLGLGVITSFGDGKTRYLLTENVTDHTFEKITPQNVFNAAEVAVQANTVGTAQGHTIDFQNNSSFVWTVTDVGTRVVVSAAFNSSVLSIDPAHGNVGIGQPNPNDDTMLHIGDNTSTGSPNSAILVARTITSPPISSSHGVVVADEVFAADGMGINAYDDRTIMKGNYGSTPNPQTHRYSFQGSLTFAHQGTLPIYDVFYSQSTLAGLSPYGRITNYNGLHVINPIVQDPANPSNRVSIGTLRGIRIEHLTRGDDNIAIQVVASSDELAAGALPPRCEFFGPIHVMNNSLEYGLYVDPQNVRVGIGTNNPGAFLAGRGIVVKAQNGRACFSISGYGTADGDPIAELGFYNDTTRVGMIQAYRDTTNSRCNIQWYVTTGSGLTKAMQVNVDASVTMPCDVASTSRTTGTLTLGGGLGVWRAIFAGEAIDTQTQFQVAGTKVLGARNTGWATSFGGATSKATFDTTTVTTQQLAERVAALILALNGHGITGA